MVFFFFLAYTSIRTKTKHPTLLVPIPIFISHPINQCLLAQARRWDPLAAFPRLHLANIHGVDFLQRPPLRLAHEEIDNQDGGEIAAGKDVTVFESNVGNDKGREEGDEEVPYPVGRGDERHAAGAVVRGEQLADDAPDDGTPCRGVKGDEDARKDDHGGPGPRGGGGMRAVEREGADGGEDEETDRHADTAYDQSPATTEALHDVQTEERHAEINTAEDHGCHVAVFDACGFEDCRSVVEEEICACSKINKSKNQRGTPWSIQAAVPVSCCSACKTMPRAVR